MKLSEYDIDKHEGRRVPSPGRCIYCIGTDDLTDEHIVPFALGAHSIVFRDASCKRCAETIQPYEQEVLLKQLGVFRAQVDAPTRRPKSRARHADLRFVEVDGSGAAIRDLGTRTYLLEEVPLTLALWQLPEASILRPELEAEDGHGNPWAYCDRPVAQKLAQIVAAETGSQHVAVEVAKVRRDHFLRFLAKTAHAFAVAVLGLDSFRPFLTDIILCRSSDFSKYVGGGPQAAPHEVDPSTTTLLHVGQVDGGPAGGLVAVRLQIYPQLGSPAYVVIVGEPKADVESLADEFGSQDAR